ncbi:hypothetical protein BN1708_019903, partial [Verticillium longisporum]
MASISTSALRQAGRLCRTTAASPLRRLPTAPRVIAGPIQQFTQRRNVSETRQDHAQVNVDTAIKLDKKDFIDQSPDGSNVVVSPMAEVLKQVTTMEEGQRPIYL